MRTDPPPSFVIPGHLTVMCTDGMGTRLGNVRITPLAGGIVRCIFPAAPGDAINEVEVFIGVGLDYPEPRSVAPDAYTRTGVYLGELRDV